MVQDCRSMADFSALLVASQEKPVFLFKHSTRCPISASRWRVLQEYAERESRADFWKLLVVEDRLVSMHVADQTGVRHQSPQAILLHRGKPVWDESHYRITTEDMQAALERALGG
jgi:bacillithiol system protein YtxJ